MKTASARIDNARISLKHSIVLCKEIRGKKVEKAKRILQNLIDEKVSLKRKYYTKASKKILELVKSAEANAKAKNMDVEKLLIKKAKADKGEKFIRPKTRWRFRGRKAKSTNITIVVR